MEEKNKRRIKFLLLVTIVCVFTIVLTLSFNLIFRHYEPLVYKTEWGDKYHAFNCSYLHTSSIPIPLSKCKELKLTSCSRCGGKSYEMILVNIDTNNRGRQRVADPYSCYQDILF